MIDTITEDHIEKNCDTMGGDMKQDPMMKDNAMAKGGEMAMKDDGMKKDDMMKDNTMAKGGEMAMNDDGMKKGDTTILISPNSEFMRYFNNLEGKR